MKLSVCSDCMYFIPQVSGLGICKLDNRIKYCNEEPCENFKDENVKID